MIKNKITDLIKNTFDRAYFADQGSIQTEEKLREQIKEFNNKYPFAISYFNKNLKDNFPKAEIENWTQFFNLDRCIRF